MNALAASRGHEGNRIGAVSEPDRSPWGTSIHHRSRVNSIAPRKPGTYEFVGEYHEETAKGRLIAE